MKRQWTREELAEHWTLDRDELALLANKTGATRDRSSTMRADLKALLRTVERLQADAAALARRVAAELARASGAPWRWN